MNTISRARAAAAVKAARDTVLQKAGVPDDPRSAAAWAFARLYDALAENLIASGRDNVAVTYRDLAILASQRGKGKKTKPSSLRKPFSENVWTGSLLEMPFHDNGLSLHLHLHPARRRGRPLILTASFTADGKPITVDGANPNGDQPILEASRRAQTRANQAQKQSRIARRFIESLRDAGFERVDELSQWFERHGLHIAPAAIIATLVAIVLAATASAGYLAVRYLIVHGLVRLITRPSRQGQLPTGYELPGKLMGTTKTAAGTLETRVAVGRVIYHLVFDAAPYVRRYPDSNFKFAWEVFVDGRRVTSQTTPIPLIDVPVPPGAHIESWATVKPVEYVLQEGRVRTALRHPPAVLDTSGNVIGQGNHLRDPDYISGWRDGPITVNPCQGYAPGHLSPIGAVQTGTQTIQFIIRHGPVQHTGTLLKFSFGDGTVWSSAENQWQPGRSGAANLWDSYQTALTHVYASPGKYQVRFALYRLDNGKWRLRREAFGSAYIAIPPPTDIPRQVLTLDAGAKPGTATLHLLPNSEIITLESSLLLGPVQDGSHIILATVQHDPYYVAIGVPLAKLIDVAGVDCSGCLVGIDFGDNGPPLEIQANDPEKRFFLTAHEYVRSGIYQVTANLLDRKSSMSIQITDRVRVSSNAPPAIVK